MSTKQAPLLTEAQISKERLTTMARVFTRADRVLSGEQVTCRLTDEANNSAPAWSDGKTITFNVPHVGTVTSVDDIIKVTGLNYHELSHILYTPRTHTALVKKVRQKGIFPAFNMLEDQRIETLLVTKYPSTKPFFVACFMRYLLANRDQWTRVFPLAHGRKYLPKEVRDQTQARFKDQALVADFIRVIDEYRVLAFPRDDARGLVLIEEYANLMGRAMTPPTGDPFGHIKGQRPDAPSQGTPQPHAGTADKAAKEDGEKGKGGKSEKEDDDTLDDADGQGGDDDANDDADDSDDDTNGGGKSDEDDDWDDEDDDTDGSGDGDDDDDDEADWEDDDDLDGDTGGDQKAGTDDSDGDDSDSGDQSGESDSDSAGDPGKGIGKGKGNAAPTKVSDEDFADMLDEAATTAEQDEAVQQDVKTKQDVIVQGDGDTMSELDAQAYTDKPVPMEVVQASKKFGKDLRLLRDEQDPGWHREQASGRLNVQRAMRGDDLDVLFDRWDEGRNEAADVEAVILLDYSGSMSRMMKDASESMWAIKRAFEEVGGKVTVIGYSDSATLMYDGNTKVSRNTYKLFGPAGGTSPGIALNEAARILHKTRRKSKFLISISDGAWGSHDYYTGDDEPYLDKVARFNAHGVVTAMLYLIDPSYAGRDDLMKRVVDNIDWQDHKVRVASMGAAGLANLSMDIVKARLRQPVK